MKSIFTTAAFLLPALALTADSSSQTPDQADHGASKQPVSGAATVPKVTIEINPNAGDVQGPAEKWVYKWGMGYVPLTVDEARGKQMLESRADDLHAMESIQLKLKTVVVPEVDFRDVTLREALAFIRDRISTPIVCVFPELHPTPASANPTIPGLEAPSNVIDPTVGFGDSRIKLSLQNISAGELLRYVTALASCKVVIAGGVIVIRPLATGGSYMASEKYYDIPPGVASHITRESLEAKGVRFVSSIEYNEGKECLTVQSPDPFLIRIEAVLDELYSKQENAGSKPSSAPETSAKGSEVAVDQRLREALGEKVDAQTLAIDQRTAVLTNDRDVLEMKQELQRTIVDKVEIENASLNEICRAFCGLDRVIICATEIGVDPNIRISLSARNASVMEIMEEIAKRTNTKALIISRAVVFVPAAAH